MRKHTGPEPLTPEELLDGTTSEPFEVKLRCRPCGSETSLRTPWATVAMKEDADDWDGVVLGCIFTCPCCGAVDNYELTDVARAQLIAEMGIGISDKARGCRVLPSRPTLFDGTTLRRPSQGLAHLRALTVKQPDNPEAWRRLGNFCERYDLLDEAVPAWRKAFGLNADEFEAAYSLANYYRRPATAEGAALWGKHLIAAVERFPRDKTVDERKRFAFAEALTRMLFEAIDQTDEPIALTAVWSCSERGESLTMNLSSADLRAIQRREGVAEFMARPDIVALGITRELPTDGPSRLQQIIEYGSSATSPIEPRRALVSKPTADPRRPKRNAPCHCGSGKKYKKCHLLIDERRSR